MHKSQYKQFINGISNSYCTSYEIIKNNNYKYELIKYFPCDNKKELHNEEAKYIKNINCVNKVIPNRTKKQYYIDNRDNILKSIKIKFTCDCGRSFMKVHKTRHIRSKYHESYFNGDWLFNINI